MKNIELICSVVKITRRHVYFADGTYMTVRDFELLKQQTLDYLRTRLQQSSQNAIPISLN